MNGIICYNDTDIYTNLLKDYTRIRLHYAWKHIAERSKYIRKILRISRESKLILYYITLYVDWFKYEIAFDKIVHFREQINIKLS